MFHVKHYDSSILILDPFNFNKNSSEELKASILILQIIHFLFERINHIQIKTFKTACSDYFRTSYFPHKRVKLFHVKQFRFEL